MPKVKRYSEPIVAQRDIPDTTQSIRTTAADFGATEGQALEGLGGAVGNIGDLMHKRAMKMRDEDDARGHKRDYIAFSKELRRITTGDDKAPGFYSSQGENAIKGYQSTLEQINKLKKDFISKAENKRIQSLLEDSLGTLVSNADTKMSEFVLRERKAADKAGSEAFIQEQMDTISATWGSEGEVSEAVDNIRMEARSMGVRAGLRDTKESPALKNFIESQVSTAHVMVMNRAMDENPDYANEYFKKHGKELDAKSQVVVEKVLTAAVRERKATEKADEIVAQASTYGDRKKLADKISDKELKKEVMANIDIATARDKKVKDEREEGVVDQVHLRIEQGGRPTAQEVEAYIAAGGTKANLNKLMISSVEGSDRPQNEDKWIEFGHLSDETMANMTEAEFKAKWLPHFNKSHTERADAMLNQEREKMGKRVMPDKHKATLSYEKIAKISARNSGIIPQTKGRSQWSNGQAKSYDKFAGELVSRVHKWESAQVPKRKASPEDIQTLAKEMETEMIYVDDWWDDSRKHVLDLDESEIEAAYILEDEFTPKEAAILADFNFRSRKYLSKDQKQKIVGQLRLGNIEAAQVLAEGK